MKFIIILILLFNSNLIAQQQTDKVTGSELIGGDFTLTNHTGKTVTNKDFFGKNTLVFFGFTNCPSICPLGLQRMISSLKKIDDFENYIIPIFISVDPKRDTTDRLSSYIKNFHPSLVGLTGNKEEINKVVKAYRAYYYKIKDKNSDNYTIDHSSIIYLMNKEGKYLTHFSSTETSENISNKIKSFLTYGEKHEK